MVELGFSIKEFIEGTLVPRIERIQMQVDELDKMARDGSPFGQREVDRVQKQMAEMRRDIEAIKKALLTPDSVSTLLSESLQKTEARGWTHRERLMGVGLFFMSFLSLLATLYSLRTG